MQWTVKAFRKIRSHCKLQFSWTENRFESPTFLSRNVVVNRIIPNQVYQPLNYTRSGIKKTVRRVFIPVMV